MATIKDPNEAALNGCCRGYLDEDMPRREIVNGILDEMATTVKIKTTEPGYTPADGERTLHMDMTLPGSLRADVVREAVVQAIEGVITHGRSGTPFPPHRRGELEEAYARLVNLGREAVDCFQKNDVAVRSADGNDDWYKAHWERQRLMVARDIDTLGHVANELFEVDYDEYMDEIHTPTSVKNCGSPPTDNLQKERK